MDFGKDVTGGIRFVAINDIEEFMLDKEDPCHVGPSAIFSGLKEGKSNLRSVSWLGWTTGWLGTGLLDAAVCVFRRRRDVAVSDIVIEARFGLVELFEMFSS